MPKPTAPLDAQALSAQLSGTRFADIRYLAETVSTNTDAQSLLGDDTHLGTTIVAEYQTAGSGRKGRRWFAPPGCALLFTTLLPAPIASATLWTVPFWIALCVADAVEAHTGVRLDLVWPNDLFSAGAKVGGILSVARIGGDEAWVGCGVGINVHRPGGESELDAVLPQPAFLDDLTNVVSREALLVEILHAFEREFGGLREPRAVAKRWEQRAGLRGTTYRYRRDSDGVERDGVAQRIGDHGSLIVRDATGEVAIDMADVRIVARGDRPASGELPAQQ